VGKRYMGLRGRKRRADSDIRDVGDKVKKNCLSCKKPFVDVKQIFICKRCKLSRSTSFSIQYDGLV
tara:strand:+ start:13 stop:210 length:198 start_codon:yes stop_codon:yes gene_type:complete